MLNNIELEFDFDYYPGKKQTKENVIWPIKPLVSIVTPYYNSKKYFKETYNSIINQTFQNFEWIIVDDCSSNSEDIEYLKKFINIDYRIKIFFNNQNKGAANAINFGIKNMSTDIFFTINADDLIEDNAIELMYIALLNNKDCDVCFSNNIGFGEKNYVWNKEINPNLMKKTNDMVSFFACRKNIIESIGLYEESLKVHFEDWEVWLKFISKDVKFIKLENYLFWYRRRSNSSVSNVDEKSVDIIKRLGMTFDKECVEIYNTNYITKEYESKKDIIALENVKNSINIDTIIIADEYNFDLINLKYDISSIKSYNVALIVLTMCDNIAILEQKLKKIYKNIYTLSTFLSTNEYIHFINYVIRNNKIVNIIYVNKYVEFLKNKLIANSKIAEYIYENKKLIEIIDYNQSIETVDYFFNSICREKIKNNFFTKIK